MEWQTQTQEQAQEEQAEEQSQEEEQAAETKPQDRKDKRFTDLSEKVKTTAEERDAAKREAEFYKGFSAVTAKYKGANDYEDQIKEKVMKGYSIEDAALTTLASEGKLAGAPKSYSAGGSANTQLPAQEEKPIGEMSLEEKRTKLLELEQKGELRL